MYDKICENCGNGFSTKHKEQRFCSNSCSKLRINKSVRSLGISMIKCINCSLEFEVQNSVLSRGRRAGSFCSPSCYSEFSRGENNPNWRGGDTFDNNIKALNLKKLHLIVRQRDNYTCQECGRKEIDTPHDIHHIIPYRISKDDSLENLITLCINCHRKKSGKELKLFKSS